MADQKLVIADGHHRYETALNYRNERRAQAGTIPDAPYERAMMTFINTQGAGLTILPTHRVVAKLRAVQLGGIAEAPGAVVRGGEHWFQTRAGKPKREEFLRKLSAARAQRAIGVYPRPKMGRARFMC